MILKHIIFLYMCYMMNFVLAMNFFINFLQAYFVGGTVVVSYDAVGEMQLEMVVFSITMVLGVIGMYLFWRECNVAKEVRK